MAKNKSNKQREIKAIYGYTSGKKVIFLMEKLGRECWGLLERIGISNNSFFFTSVDSGNFADKWYYENPISYLQQNHTQYENFMFEEIDFERYVGLRNDFLQTSAAIQLYSHIQLEEYAQINDN